MTATSESEARQRSTRQHARLRRQLREAAVEMAAATSRGRRAEVLGRLRLTLEEHFSFEEESGYLTEVLRRAPRLQHSVGELEREHALLRAELAELLHAAEAGTAGSAEEIDRRFIEFRRRLESHEDRENDVMQDAFELDVGVGD